MSYVVGKQRLPLGQEPAPTAVAQPANCPAGFAPAADGVCRLLPGAGIPSEMVGYPPGTMKFVPATPTLAGHWTRTRTGEVGVLPEGLQVRDWRGGDGVATVSVAKAGELVKVGEVKNALRKECEETGMPPELFDACYRMRAIDKKPLDQVLTELQAAHAAEQEAAAIAQAEAVASSGRRRIFVYAALGIGGAGLLYFLLRRKRS